MIARLVYVTCDGCYRPCGSEEQMADGAREARRLAKALGWKRVDGHDLCPKCA